MRIARTLILLGLTALAAAAAAAPANGAITVTDESTELPCGAVVLGAHHLVTGGCRIHIVSIAETRILIGTVGGPVLISSCEDELEARIGGNGEGYVYSINNATHPPPSVACTREGCDEAETAPEAHTTMPWRLHFREDGSGEFMHMVFCFYSRDSAEGTPGVPCQLLIPMTQTANPHQQTFNAEANVHCINLPFGAVTVIGHWRTEAASVIHPEIVVSH